MNECLDCGRPTVEGQVICAVCRSIKETRKEKL